MDSLILISTTSLLAILLAMFLQHPAPNLSKEALQWNSTGSTFNYNGHQVFFKDVDGYGKEVLLCIHGFPTSGYDWIKVLPSLQKMFKRVIIPDMIGFGFSDKKEDHDYSIMEQADIMEKLLLHLGVSSVHILAHDYGDTVAQELLARNAEQSEGNTGASTGLVLTTVCLLNGGIFPEMSKPRILQKVGRIPYLGKLVGYLIFYKAFRRGLGETFGPHTQPTEEEFLDFYALFLYKNGNKISNRLLGYIGERSQFRDRWVGSIQQTNIPLHTIYGPADPVNPPPFEEYYRKHISGASISVLDENIGHYPQWEAPDLVMKYYQQFISKHLT